MGKNKILGILLVVIAVAVLAGIFIWGSKGTEEKVETANEEEITAEQEVEGTSTASTNEAFSIKENQVAITVDNFDAEVVKSTVLTVVEVYAHWCPHCKNMSEVIDSLTPEYLGQVKFGKMNADNQDPAQKANFDFAIANGLEGYPTIWVYKGGERVEVVSGEMKPDPFKELIKKYL